jgi:hypothetical protein
VSKRVKEGILANVVSAELGPLGEEDACLFVHRLLSLPFNSSGAASLGPPRSGT